MVGVSDHALTGFSVVAVTEPEAGFSKLATP
jgi:hypothetical protein